MSKISKKQVKLAQELSQEQSQRGVEAMVLSKAVLLTRQSAVDQTFRALAAQLEAKEKEYKEFENSAKTELVKLQGQYQALADLIKEVS